MNRSARTSESVLDRIVRTKAEEVAALSGNRTALRQAAEAAPAPRGFEQSLSGGDTVALIAEFKRRSPSAGSLGDSASPVPAVRAYEEGGAAALSVLTDEPFFGGSLDDLRAARAAVNLPVLRKDFVLDEVQLYEARAAGADAVLLIVRILEDARLRALLELCVSLGIDALVEVHDESELERALAAGARVVGINNRDLATFVTDPGVTLALAPRVPADCVLVAESGITSSADVVRLAAAGVDAVLVGGTLMSAGDVRAAVASLASTPRNRARSGMRGRPEWM